jgi:hypothetical protein
MLKKPQIVLMPTQGLCNRLRAIASAHILATFLETTYYVIWEKEECCNCDITDLFKNHFYSIDLEDIIDSRYLYSPNTHTDKLIPVVFPKDYTPNQYDYIIIKGGHEFKHGDMLETSFIQKKQMFYSNLIVQPSITSIIGLMDTSECVGIHYRDFIPKYDAMDGRDFTKSSPLDDFVKIVKHMFSKNQKTRFFVSSNTIRAKNAIADIIPNENIMVIDDVHTDRNTLLGVQYAVANLLLLSKCKYIIGTLMSSFSDEACFFNNISKVCIGHEDVKTYHCHGFGQIMHHKMLLPNFNILCDIYKDNEH